MAIVMLVHVGLIMHTESGPLWDRMLHEQATFCKRNWWTAILHIQNYVHNAEMVCNGLAGDK